MQCKDVERALEQDGPFALSETARAHLDTCGSCRTTVADLSAIVAAARKLPQEVQPPARVWVSLCARLEAEAIIREPAPAPVVAHAPWWQGFAQLFGNRLLAASLVAGLIIAAAVTELHKSNTAPSDNPVSPIALNDQLFHASQTLNEQERDLTDVFQASTSPVDTSLRKNLKELDEFIAECEQHLRESPQDQLAREYLAAAYQQKAELLSAMIDRGRSVN